jgi:hypothetical protein
MGAPITAKPAATISASGSRAFVGSGRSNSPKHSGGYCDKQECARWSIHQRWEAEDASRPKPPPPSKPEYRTPQATVDCFFGWIVRQDEATQARWLAEHPKDAAYLRKLWEDKCKAQSK